MTKFYVTTAIDYVNDKPHIGHALQKIAADVLARWHKQKGEDVFFLTGTDEHGQKILENAQKQKITPRQFVNTLVPTFKNAWKSLNLDYTKFIRTTDKYHEEAAQRFFKILLKKGDIYKGAYKGLYCVGCENYVTEKDLVGGKCPLHDRVPEELNEAGYFFKLSKYQNALLKLYAVDPEFVLPESRRNEIENRVSEGLQDWFISRKVWGIKIPGEEELTLYVWFEALLNYISALSWPSGKNYKKYWPADVHLLGKDNAWFHCVIWPALLLSAGIKLPKTVYVHGFLSVDGQKISKSLGNVIYPGDLSSKYGADACRYFFTREVTLAEDGNYSERALVERYNGELADELGNLVSRSLTLIEKYSGGEVPRGRRVELSADVRKALAELKSQKAKVNITTFSGTSTLRFRIKGNISLDAASVENPPEVLLFATGALISNFELHNAISVIWNFIRNINKHIQDTKPWELAKDSKNKKELNQILFTLADSLRTICALIYPFIPATAEEIAKQLGIKKVPLFKGLKKPIAIGTKVKKGGILFPKLEYKDLTEEFLDKKVIVDKQIQKEISEGKLSVCLAEFAGLNVQTRAGKLEKLKSEIIKHLDERKLKKIFDSYRYMFEKIDRNPAGVSPENLLAHVKENKQLPNINTVTDAYNLVSLKTGLIMGVYDEKNIAGNVRLKVADGTEHFVEIGQREEQKIYPGEYVLADEQNKIITKWLTKQSDKIKVTKATRQAILCVQGNKDISQKEVEKVAKEVCELVTQFCGGKYKIIYP